MPLSPVRRLRDIAEVGQAVVAGNMASSRRYLKIEFALAWLRGTMTCASD